MDSDQFCAPPTTTVGLTAYFTRYGRSSADCDITLVHFLQEDEIEPWFEGVWLGAEAERAREAALEFGRQLELRGFSVATQTDQERVELLVRHEGRVHRLLRTAELDPGDAADVDTSEEVLVAMRADARDRDR